MVTSMTSKPPVFLHRGEWYSTMRGSISVASWICLGIHNLLHTADDLLRDF